MEDRPNGRHDQAHDYSVQPAECPACQYADARRGRQYWWWDDAKGTLDAGYWWNDAKDALQAKHGRDNAECSGRGR